jgi:hypothetical protein
MTHDPALVDYGSPHFEVGYRAGQHRQASPGERDTLTDTEWASRVEGWLMGTSEPVWTRAEVERRYGPHLTAEDLAAILAAVDPDLG